MKRWPTMPLGDLVLPTEQRDPKENPTEGFTYVDIASVDNETKAIGTTKRIIGADAPSRAKKVIRKGDMIVSTVRPNLNAVALIPKSLDSQICSTGFSVLRPSPQVTSGYLFAFTRSPLFIDHLVSRTTGANYPAVNDGEVKDVPIPLPPLAEQERIVKLLDEADELRTLRAQADTRKAQLIPALFHEMFGDPMENAKGWSLRPVSSFVEELHGGRSVNPAGADEGAGRYRVLKISAVTWGEFKPNESKPVVAGYEPPKSHFVQAGDLLFSRANTTELVAATSYVFDTPPNLLLPDKLWRFVWKQPQRVEPLFVWWLFQAPSIRRELGQRATGTGGSMKNISKPKVMTLEVPVPPLPLQKEFAQRVTEIRALAAAQAASRQRLEALFQSLLHRAFNGEL